jgi:hypothetical protein
VAIRLNPEMEQCALCEAEQRHRRNHYIFECPYISAEDRWLLLNDLNEWQEEEDCSEGEEEESDKECVMFDRPEAVYRRVDLTQAPVLVSYFKSRKVVLTLNSGTTTNFVRTSFVEAVGMPIRNTSQTARHAYDTTPLTVRGSVHCVLQGEHSFLLVLMLS